MHPWIFSILLLFYAFLLSACQDDEEVIATAFYPRVSPDSIAKQTGLPVIVINTNDASSISDKETWEKGILIFTDSRQQMESFSDSIEVKGRGNVSFQYPKKSFTLKFEHKQSILGMPKHKRWVFQANYHDRTLMRNALTFHLGHYADGMEWNPHAEYAEVIFNGQHIGNYLVCEQIRVDKNRIPISEEYAEDEDCGFIYEYDLYFDGENRFFTPINYFPVCISYPQPEDCTPAQLEYAKRFIRKAETKLLSKNYDSLFDKYFDLDSFVDYWIVMTITGNIEPSAPRSVFFYKKPSGKLFAGPLWDFDYSTYKKVDGNLNTDVLYYTRLFKSSDFRLAVVRRWNELSPVLRRELQHFIKQNRDYLSQSAELNYSIWPITVAFLNKCRNGDELYSYEQAVDSLCSKAYRRMDYLDGIVRSFATETN